MFLCLRKQFGCEWIHDSIEVKIIANIYLSWKILSNDDEKVANRFMENQIWFVWSSCCRKLNWDWGKYLWNLVMENITSELKCSWKCEVQSNEKCVEETCHRTESHSKSMKIWLIIEENRLNSNLKNLIQF